MSQFSISQRGYYSLQQELDGVGENYDQLCNLIVQFQITPAKWPRTPAEAITLIRQHIDKVSRSFYNVKDQMLRRSELLIDTLRKCRKHQISCQTFYEDAAKEVGKLNKLMTCQLSIYRPHFMEQIKQRARQLGDGRMKIMILGEICAGKSSILNIWMDGHYFPVGHGHCTKIPCEVRNDTKRHAYLYYDSEPWARPSESFELSTNPDDASWVRVQKCVVNGYDEMSDNSNPLHKIVIRWPLRMYETDQIKQLQRNLEKEKAMKLRRPRLTVSEPTGTTSHTPVTPNVVYSRSEETEVLKPPKTPTASKKPTQEPILEYKGVQMPALQRQTLPKTPAETSDSSPDTDNEETTVKFDFENIAAGEAETLSGSYDDTLKLVNGITFVDAPGIYDTEESFLNLQSYIQSCDAFIFVISNAETEGLARDRVMKLMEIVRQTCEEKNNFFNPQCALFLCNKWDIVDEADRETLQERVLQRIRECWPTVSSKQLLPISGSKQILREIQDGKVPALYEKFYYGVCSFIEMATSISIESNCWWLTTFLDKIVTLQRKAKKISNYSRHQQREVKESLTEIRKSMLEVSDRQNETSQTLEEDKVIALNNMQERIKKLLKANIGKLREWNNTDIPARENGLAWRKYHHELNRAIAKRLEQLLVDDEESNVIIDGYEEKIKEKLYKMKALLTQEDKKASYLQPLTASIDVPSENSKILPKAKLPLLVLAMIVTLPVAPLILIVWHIIEEMTVPVLQDDEELFNKDPRAYMRKQTEIFVDKLVKERLALIAETRLEALSNNAKHMMQFFFTCIENRLKSIDEMTQQVESQIVTHGNMKTLNGITTELSRFYIRNIMKHDIIADNLRVDTENPAKIIGSGYLSSVVKGQYFDDGDYDVAVKVVKWPAGEEEAIFRECFLLRQLSLKSDREKTNFVKFYGSTFDEYQDTFKLMLVCELCDTDLAKLIQMEELILPSGTGVQFPGSDPQKGQGWNYFFSLAKQAANGLQFVHSNGIVHRDVKPANFLLKFSGGTVVVKIADVGLSRSVDLNITSRIGTKYYSPPEVQLGSLHSYSGDVYSFSLVLFELWYGKAVSFQHPERPKLNFYYPAPQLTDTRPPRGLEDIMKASWRYVPSDRPPIGAVLRCLCELSEKYRFGRVYVSGGVLHSD